MLDANTKQPLRVSPIDTGGGRIRIPAAQRAAVATLLQAHGVRHWVGEDVYSFNGGPEYGFISLSKNEDAATIQAILDSVP